MKFTKKIISVSLLGIIVASSLQINGSNIFANNTDISKNISNKSTNVEDFINSEKYESIKKIELDNSGNPKSSKNIDLARNIPTGLSNGIYTIDRGDGWVLRNDGGYIQNMIVPAGAKGIFSTSKEVEFENRIEVAASSSFGTDFVQMTIKAGYGASFINSQKQDIYKVIAAPNDKNIFVKVQSIYRKIEVINVKNGNIVDLATTFKPTGHTFSSIEFKDNEHVKQNKLYERFDRCILGESGYEIKQIRNEYAQYRSEVLNVRGTSNQSFTLDTVVQNKPYGIYFTVPESGKYNIRDMIYHYSFWSKVKGDGVPMTLYKTSQYNDKEIELVKAIWGGFFNSSYDLAKFEGDPLTVDLQSGQKYLLMFNENMDTFWPNIVDPITYRVNFDKIG